MRGGWLGWRDGRLVVVADGGRVVGEPPGEISREHLGEIGFAVGRSWQLLLPPATALRVLASADAAAWLELPSIPVHGPPNRAVVGLHPDSQRVSVVEPRWLHAWEEHGGWRTLPLPEGAVWVGEGTEGEWWAVGHRPAERVRGADREVAAWRRSGDAWTPVPIRAAWRDAFRAIRDGGFESLRAIDARAEPVVLASECAWFLDDPSWFLFTARPTGSFAIQRLAGRALARLHRDLAGRPVAITTDGEVWDWTGRRWKERGCAQRLRAACRLSDGYRVHLALGEAAIYGVVVVARGQREERLAVRSPDEGRSWERAGPDALLGTLPVAAWVKG